MISTGLRRRLRDTAVFAVVFAPIAAVGVVPALALDTTLEGISVDTADMGKVQRGPITIEGTNLAQDEVVKLFGIGTSQDERKALFAKFEATKVSIPDMVATDKDGKKITFSNVTATGISHGKAAHATLGGFSGAFKADGGDGTIAGGPVVVDGIDLSGIFGQTAGSLAFTHFALQSLEVTGPDRDTPATTPGGNMLKVQVGSLNVDTTFDGSVPLETAVVLDGLVITPPPASPSTAQLKAAGFDKLELGLRYRSTYDPAAKVFALDELTITGKGAGGLRLKTRLGGIDKSVFTAPSQDKAGLLMQGSIQALELAYTDAGLLEKSFGIVATQQGKTPAALRAESAAMVRQMVPMMLGGAANAPAIADTLGRFIEKPDVVTVTLKPKSGAITVPELMQLQDPMSFLAKVDLKVSGSGTAPAPTPAAPAVTPPAPAPAPVTVAPAPAGKLTGLEAWKALIGNTIAGKDTEGQPLWELYLADGTVKQLSDDKVLTGKWSTKKGDRICFEFEGEEAVCYTLTVDGDIATFIDSDNTGIRYKVLPGNPKKL